MCYLPEYVTNLYLHYSFHGDRIEVFKKNFFNVYFIFDRERQSMSGGGAERKGDTESQAGSRV